MRERKCGFDGEADGAEACRVEAVQGRYGGDQEFQRDEGDEEVEEELPVPVRIFVSNCSQIMCGRKENSRLMRPPLPEIIRSGNLELSVFCPRERNCRFSSF